MTLAIVFPGQGSQSVGMGKAMAAASPAARAVFDEVDDALGQDLSNLIFEGPEEELTLTANAQPALMAVSMAAIRFLEDRGHDIIGDASFVAGHSLGEYSALCAAGSISLADTARLLRVRGNAMQEAVPVGEGAMAAIIGLEHDDVAQVCADASNSGACQIANDNGGGQIVISGTKSAVELAAESASTKGAKRAILLPVSAPFHSALMAPAADAMSYALSNVEVVHPRVPVVANVVAKPITEPTEIVPKLVEQVTGQVRWRESVMWMAENGVDMAVEAGSGKVLSGLIRRIAREIQTHPAGTPEDMEKLIAVLNK